MSADLVGRALDAEIERRVFGRKIGIFTNGEYRTLKADWDVVGVQTAPTPPYSTDIAAAWLVVERMRQVGLEREFEDALRNELDIESGQGDVAEHVRVALHRLLNGSVPTAERFCRAALAVLDPAEEWG